MLIKISVRFSIILLIFQMNFVQNVFGQTPAETVMLELGKSIEREIAGGEQHNFQIPVPVGQYAKIIVEQKDINLFARLTDANGKIVVEVDKNIEKTGEEVVEIYTAAEGLKLMVAARNSESPQAKYKIELVEIRQPTAKETALQEARTLVNNAIELWLADKYAEAQPLVERSLAIRQREWGNENFEVAQAFFVLGNIVGDLGDLDQSEKYYKRALEIAEKTLGKDNLYNSGILNNWGITYKVRGDYLKAEELYLRSLAIKEKLLDANHPQIANLLNNLGTIYSSRGDNQKAAEFYRRALAIREKTFGAEHPQVALSLNNLAGVSDDPIVKEQLYLRALAIREKTLGTEHKDVAQTLYNLGRLSAATGDYTKAEEFMQRALTISEKALGKEHQFISYPLNLLGAIYKFQGKYDEAETFLERAAELKEKMQSPLHPELGGTLSFLAGVYALKGDIEKAVATQKRANEILEYNTLLNLQIGSEREKLDYLQTLEAVNSDTLNLYFQAAKNSKAAREIALTAVLQRKGRVLDAMSDGYTALRRRFDKQDQKLFDDLNTATNELIGFVTNGGEAKSSDEYGKGLKKLEEKREEIEDQISRRSFGYYEKSKSVTLEQVRNLIPANAVLIEFVVYRPGSIKLSGFNFSENKKAYQEPRYAAFVVGANGTTNAQDLGTVREIDAIVNKLRYALRDPKSTNVKEIAGVLNEKLMQPLSAFNANATHLFISPDGALNLIPFEALVDEKGRYLVENHSFTYLTSGRDLLRMQPARTTSKSKPLIITNPSFGASTNAQTSDSRADTTYFAPLAATISEGRVIQTEFPDSLLLTGVAATETAIKQVTAPLLLHIATHGFFLEDADELNTEKISGKRSSNAKTETENPLLRSGLALAGANSRKGGAKEDGILTALEASGLNLWGTKMVVLSACDTGLGEVKNGEGVYGLRRALTLAGTETLVMSLWQVSDSITKELMINYYKNLKSGLGRGASLRQVQLEMLKNPKRQHPFYWASFIQSGEWANLEGKR